MLETIGVAKNGRYVLPPREDELLTNLLIDCDNHFVKAKWTKVGKPKTNKQLAVHFAVAVERVRRAMAEQGITICNVVPNKIMVHEILTDLCGGVGPLGEKLRLSQMTSDQAYRFFENIRDFAAERLQIVIPDPDPEWKNKTKG